MDYFYTRISKHSQKEREASSERNFIELTTKCCFFRFNLRFNTNWSSLSLCRNVDFSDKKEDKNKEKLQKICMRNSITKQTGKNSTVTENKIK